MGIGVGVAVTGEMLGGGRDSGVMEPLNIGATQSGHFIRIGAEGAVADNRILGSCIDVQNRREVKIKSQGP